MKKTVLITGVNGFLGSALWSYLQARKSKFKVFGLDAKAAPSQKEVFRCNLHNQKKLAGILSKINPDYIFHLAGGRPANPEALLKSNLSSTEHLLETVAKLKNGCPRIIIPGSAAEYGRLKHGQRLASEKVLPKPVSHYGCVKYMQTTMGLIYARKGFDVVVARMFNICGSGTPPSLVVGKFAREISFIEKGKKPVISTGDLRGKRDFLDVADVCSALVSVAEKGKSGEVYNVCSGKSYSIRDILKKLLGYSKRKNIAVDETREGASESFNSAGSNQKIRKELRWRPKISIERSLKDTLNGYRK